MNFVNRMKRKILAGETALGFGVHHLRTAAAPMLADATGHDWLFIDCELGGFSSDEVAQLCLATLPTGLTPIVRVRADALGEGARALDNGALGVVVPRVESAQQARDVVQTLRLAPRGVRSPSPICPQRGFKSPPSQGAPADLDEQTVLIAMIETPEGVARAEEIARIDGIDGLLVGAHDLSVAMKVKPSFEDDAFLEAVKAVNVAARRSSIFFGMGGLQTEEGLRAARAQRVDFLLTGSDHSYILNGARRRVEAFANAASSAAVPTRSVAAVSSAGRG